MLNEGIKTKKYILYYQDGNTQVVDAIDEEDAMKKASCSVVSIELASKEFLELYGLIE